MRSRTLVLVLVPASCLLVIDTVLVFLTFHRQSHSASDTLRPFAITMLPVWPCPPCPLGS